MGVSFSVLFIVLITSIPLVGQESLDSISLKNGESRTLTYYESILHKYPEMAEARFGAGYAAYNLEDYKRALSEFESALKTENPQLKSKTFYNLGNTLHKEGRFEESLLAYRKALELNPEDADAKYNYELTRQIMQKLQDPHSQSSPNDREREQSEQRKEQPELSQDQPQHQPQQNQRQLQNQETKNQEEKDQQLSQQEQAPKNDKKPDAELILNALKSDEKNLMKRQLSRSQSKKMEKDW